MLSQNVQVKRNREHTDFSSMPLLTALRDFLKYGKRPKILKPKLV